MSLISNTNPNNLFVVNVGLATKGMLSWIASMCSVLCALPFSTSRVNRSFKPKHKFNVGNVTVYVQSISISLVSSTKPSSKKLSRVLMQLKFLPQKTRSFKLTIKNSILVTPSGGKSNPKIIHLKMLHPPLPNTFCPRSKVLIPAIKHSRKNNANIIRWTKLLIFV